MIPRLLHPVPVYVSQVDKAGTPVFDDLLHEAVGQIQRDTTIRLVAQHSSVDVDKPDPTSKGVVEESSGYFLFRMVDLRQAGIMIRRGDRIVQMGDAPNGITVDYYVTKLRYLAHYTDQSGPALVRAYYADRQPSVNHG